MASGMEGKEQLQQDKSMQAILKLYEPQLLEWFNAGARRVASWLKITAVAAHVLSWLLFQGGSRTHLKGVGPT